MTEKPDQSFEERLKAAQERRAEIDAKHRKQSGETAPTKGASLALRFGTEFAACLIVGLFMGLGLDGWFKTSPLFTLIMMGFGLAAGVLSGIRAYRNINAEAEAHAQALAGEQKSGSDPS